ncbi:MAG: hypothetical protein FWG57_02810 [Endomicrobia bacterium]|nr:hypothetical protein [Endomicrobiia bacterium]
MGNFVPGAGVGPISVISRGPNKLDAFAVGMDGGVYTAAWEPGDTAWRGWWRIDGLEAAPCAPVCAVSRSADKLDIFVVGLDRRVYGAAWEKGNTKWYGWWPIGSLKTVLHAPVSAVSRSADKMDIFVTGLDGRVYTAAWEPGFKEWQGWRQIGNVQAPPGAPVSAVSRAKDKLDIFVVGQDGRVYTAAWEQPRDTTWRGWWQIGTMTTSPRTPVCAVSRSADLLDIFVVGPDGRVYSAAWGPKDTAWRGWWRIGSIRTKLRASVSAVSRSADKMNIFVAGKPTGLLGLFSSVRVYTAEWQPGYVNWRDWRTVGNLTTALGMPIGAVSRSENMLDVVAPGTNGRVYTAAWQPGDTQWRGWWVIGNLVTGMTDPRVNDWNRVGVSFKQENNSYSEEAQGVTTDGEMWFLSSSAGGDDNNKRKISKYDLKSNRLGEIKLPENLWKKKAHIGAPGYFDGWLYVPIQKSKNGWGVWKIKPNFSEHKFLPGEEGDDRFSWCDVNPLNGRLYTSEYSEKDKKLFAYDIETLTRRPEDDIQLGSTPIHFDEIQGGVFTIRGRLIISRSKGSSNGIFCFSAVTGHCFGGKYLGKFGSAWSELEGVTVRSLQLNGTPIHVHVLELDNDNSLPTCIGGGGGDDCYLHSYRVPEPERL